MVLSGGSLWAVVGVVSLQESSLIAYCRHPWVFRAVVWPGRPVCKSRDFLFEKVSSAVRRHFYRRSGPGQFLKQLFHLWGAERVILDGLGRVFFGSRH